MAKFKDLEDAFWYIKENPLEYLPEKSLSLLNALWLGFERRYEVEFNEYKGFELLDGFNEFMTVKFRVPSLRNSLTIAKLYSKNQSEAFDLWFDCLEEFLAKKDGTTDVEQYYKERRKENPFPLRNQIDFFELIKSLDKCN